MKKFFYSLMALVLPVAMFVSCEKDVEVPPVTTPDEQKAQLEKTAIALMDELAAENFEEVSDLGAYLYEEYSEENYDYSEVEAWADDCYEALTKVFTGQKVEGDESWGWMDIYDCYKVVCRVSDFTGKLEAKNGIWKYTEADDLSFHVKDKDGNPCILRLTTSGKTTKMYFGEEYDYEDSRYEDDCYIDEGSIYEIYVHVPENINVSLTQGGKSIANVVFNADFSSIKGEELDLGKDRFNMSATAEFNGYSVVLNKFKYAPEKGTEAKATVKKGGKNLISVSASADIDITNEDFYGSANNKLAIDIMGDVQVKGSIQRDVVDIVQDLEDAFDEDMSESEFKKEIKRINDMIDLNIYYHNSNTASAKVEMRAFVETYYGEEEWDIEPVVVFNDGTSYGFEEYFNEDDFKKVIRMFERLLEDFEILVEDTFEDDVY